MHDYDKTADKFISLYDVDNRKDIIGYNISVLYLYHYGRLCLLHRIYIIHLHKVTLLATQHTSKMSDTQNLTLISHK